MYVRFLPSLLDRLMDDASDASPEGADQGGVTFQKYREGFLRDIRLLLSYGLQPAPLKVDDFPEVANSVLNYGMPNLLGVTGLAEDPRRLEENIRTAILRFEPRANPATLRIHVVTEYDESDNRMRNPEIEIEAELWAKPYSEYVYILTQIDLHDATIKVKEWRNG